MDDLVREETLLKGKIAALLKRLEDMGVDMDTPLVDAEGYPMHNVDLGTIRVMRGDVRRLLNDHKALSRQISDALPYALPPQQTSAQSKSAPAATHDAPQQDLRQSVSFQEFQEPSTCTLSPFAMFNAVEETLPAGLAGILVGDVLVRFGNVTRESFTSITSLSAELHSQQSEINVTIIRGYNQSHAAYIDVTIRNYSPSVGLGCRIIPL